MTLTKEKVMKIRDNADRLLKKMTSEEKNQYKKLSLLFANTKSDIESILSYVKDDKTFEQVSTALTGFQSEMAKTLKSVRFDVEPVVRAVGQLLLTVKSKEGYSDTNVISCLNRIEKALSKPATKAKDGTGEIVKAIKNISIGETEFPEHISIDNFPPTKVPQPVTNININPLRGFVKTTAETVSATLTVLPSYGVLDNRRAVLIYNNSSTVTVFVGGSDVTASNGMPVPPKSYSPVIDAGVRMIFYGVTSSSTANVRVMEISNDAIGG